MTKRKREYRPIKNSAQAREDGKVRMRFIYYDAHNNRRFGMSNWCDNEDDAYINALERAKEKYEQALNGKSTNYTVKEVAEAYIDSFSKNENIRMSTRATLVSTMRSLAVGNEKAEAHCPKEILKKPVSKMTPKDISVWMNYIYKTKSPTTGSSISKNTYNKQKKAIADLLDYARSLDCFDEDYSRFKALYDEATSSLYNLSDSLFKSPKSRINRVINEQQFRGLMKCGGLYVNDDGYFDIYSFNMNRDSYTLEKRPDINYMYYILFTILFYTGMRMEEARALRTDRIVFRQNEELNAYEAKIHILEAFSLKSIRGMREEAKKETGKLKREHMNRYVGVYNRIATELKNYCLYLNSIFPNDDSILLFQGIDGGLISENAVDTQLKKRINLYNNQCNDDKDKILEFSKHDFRRSRITEWLKQDVPVYRIQKLVGDNDPSMIISVYNALSKDDEYKKSAQLIDKGTDFTAEEVYKIYGIDEQTQNYLVSDDYYADQEYAETYLNDMKNHPELFEDN